MDVPLVVVDYEYIDRLNRQLNESLLSHDPKKGPEYRDGEDPREFGRRYAQWTRKRTRENRQVTLR